MNTIQRRAPYLAYVRKLCQDAALRPEELVEILHELDDGDVFNYRRRVLEVTAPWTRRFGTRPMVPLSNLSALLSRAYVAGVCAIDDLSPDALALQVHRLIVEGYTRSWPPPVATQEHMAQMIRHIEDHSRLVRACLVPTDRAYALC